MKTNLWKNINALQDVCEKTSEDFSRLIGVSEENYVDLKTKQSDIPLDIAVRISETFQIDIFDLLAGTIDLKAAKRFFSEAPFELPERYQVGQFSKLRSVINLIEGVREKCGDQYIDTLLRKSQIPLSFFDDPDKLINVRFLNDFTNLLLERGWGQSELYSLGQHSYETHKDSVFGRKMSTYRDWEEVYEALVIQHASAFDRNFDYKLSQLNQEFVVIDAHPREEVCEALKTNNFDSEPACMTRMGVMSSVACYIGQEASIVTKTRSIHQGEEFDRYVIRPAGQPIYS